MTRMTTKIAARGSLYYAAFDGELKKAEELIEAGANVNEGNCHGFTPLHFACVTDQLSVAKLLVERGAEIN